MLDNVSILLICLIASLAAVRIRYEDLSPEDRLRRVDDWCRYYQSQDNPDGPTNEGLESLLSRRISQSVLQQPHFLGRNEKLSEYYCTALKLKAVIEEARHTLDAAHVSNDSVVLMLEAKHAEAEPIVSEMVEGAKIWVHFIHLSSLVHAETMLSPNENYELTCDYNCTIQDLKKALELARSMIDAPIFIKYPAAKRIAEEGIAEAEAHMRSLHNFVTSLDAAEREFQQLRQPLEEALAKKDVEAAARALQKLNAIREKIAELERLESTFNRWRRYYTGLRPFEKRVEHAIKQGERLMKELKSQMVVEQALPA